MVGILSSSELINYTSLLQSILDILSEINTDVHSIFSLFTTFRDSVLNWFSSWENIFSIYSNQFKTFGLILVCVVTLSFIVRLAWK